MKKSIVSQIIWIQLFTFACIQSPAKTELASIGNEITLQQEYFLGVFSESMSPSALAGHAFIGIGKGTPLICSTSGSETEAWGFYPKIRIQGIKSVWFGPVDGNVRNDIYSKIENQYFIKISSEEYIKVQIKVEEWKRKQYDLTRNDCISFVIDICKLFPDKFLIPTRTQTDTPDSYVIKFIQLNKN